MSKNPAAVAVDQNKQHFVVITVLKYLNTNNNIFLLLQIILGHQN